MKEGDLDAAWYDLMREHMYWRQGRERIRYLEMGSLDIMNKKV